MFCSLALGLAVELCLNVTTSLNRVVSATKHYLST